jgi:hypothetical protein
MRRGSGLLKRGQSIRRLGLTRSGKWRGASHGQRDDCGMEFGRTGEGDQRKRKSVVVCCIRRWLFRNATECRSGR